MGSTAMINEYNLAVSIRALMDGAMTAIEAKDKSGHVARKILEAFKMLNEYSGDFSPEFEEVAVLVKYWGGLSKKGSITNHIARIQDALTVYGVW